jgi:hypothetical protein
MTAITRSFLSSHCHVTTATLSPTATLAISPDSQLATYQNDRNHTLVPLIPLPLLPLYPIPNLPPIKMTAITRSFHSSHCHVTTATLSPTATQTLPHCFSSTDSQLVTTRNDRTHPSPQLPHFPLYPIPNLPPIKMTALTRPIHSPHCHPTTATLSPTATLFFFHRFPTCHHSK